MVAMVQGGCRFSFTAVILALGVWLISGSSAMAQGGAGGMGGGGMGGGGMGGADMGGMGHTGAFGMSGVTAPGMGMGGGGRMSGMGSSGGYGSGLNSGYGYGGSSYGGTNAGGSGLGYGGSGLGYGGSGLGYGGSGLGYGYGGCGYSLYGSAPGNYYYPYSNPIYLTSSAGLGYSSANVAPAAGAGNTVTYPGRYLGIDEEPVAEAGGRKGMKVAKVYPGTAAEKAGLQAGDVIHSINSYLTEQRGNLAWIIANAAKNNVLEITVHTVRDGQEHTVTARLP